MSKNSNNCNNSDYSFKIKEYQNGINKLLKRLTDSELINAALRSEIIKLQHLDLLEKEKCLSSFEEKILKNVFNQIENLASLNVKVESKDIAKQHFVCLIEDLWNFLDSKYEDSCLKDLKFRKNLLIENLLHNQSFPIEKELVYTNLNDLKLLSELEYLKKEADILKEKVLNQTILIKNLIETYRNEEKRKLNDSFDISLYSNDKIDNNFLTLSDLNNEQNMFSPYFICPICQVTIDTNDISFGKFESHVKICNSSKLVCIFCLKLFDLNEKKKFDLHINEHMKKNDKKKILNDSQGSNLENNISNNSNLNNDAYDSILELEQKFENLKKNTSTSCASNSSMIRCSRSNSCTSTASTSSNQLDSAKSNNRNEVNNLNSSPINASNDLNTNQRNQKDILLIQKFEPKARKRL